MKGVGLELGLEVDVHAQHADEPLRLTRRAALRRAKVLVAHVVPNPNPSPSPHPNPSPSPHPSPHPHLRRAEVLVAHVVAGVGQESSIVAEGRQQRARAAARLRERERRTLG